MIVAASSGWMCVVRLSGAGEGSGVPIAELSNRTYRGECRRLDADGHRYVSGVNHSQPAGQPQRLGDARSQVVWIQHCHGHLVPWQGVPQ